MTYRLSPKIINFEERWQNLQKTLDAIVHLRPLSKMEWQNGISEIHTICSAKSVEDPGLLLYNVIRKFIRDHVREISNNLKAACDDMLVSYNAAWETYKKASFILNDFCCCLNKYVATPPKDPSTEVLSKSRKSIGNVAYSAWKRILLDEHSKYITKQAIEAVKNLRNNTYQTELDECRKYVSSLIDLNDPFEEKKMQGMASVKIAVPKEPILLIYKEMFEEDFLKETKIYFDCLCAEVYRDLDCSEYMRRVLQTISKEKLCASKYLHMTTIEKVERLGYEIFVASHLERFNSVNRFYIENDELHSQDLLNMHVLLKQVDNGLESLLHEFSDYIFMFGKEKVSSIAAANFGIASTVKFVKTIADLYKKYVAVVENVFENDRKFMSAMDRSLQLVTNYSDNPKQIPKSPEILNRFIDIMFRRGNKFGETEVETMLNQAMILFRYVGDKDLFKMYYQRMLCNRLIGDFSFSMGMEEIMISKMKELCGFEFTHGISRIFTDVISSPSLCDRFSKHLREQEQNVGIDFSIKVLAMRVWPFSLTESFEIPSAVRGAMDSFTAFYQSKHTGRKLNWILRMGRGELASYCFDQKYIFTASTPQMAILILFNETDQYVLSDMTRLLKMPQDQVIAHLQVIIKLELIKVTPGNFELDTNASGDTLLKLNDAFNSKRMKVDLSKIPLRGEVKKENDEVQKSVDEDRCMIIQAALVRIMKTRKALKHTQLMTEVIQQLSSCFQPNVPMIKKCIDILIDKEYLKRSDSDRDSYEYIA